MHRKLLIWSSRKFSPVEAEIQKKTYSDLQIKCPSLLTDLNQNWIVSSACAESDKYGVPGNFL
jgi:hypothetical protein